jgi:hypothetical protein
MSSSLEKQVLRWYATGQTGLSSKAMACVACGIVPTDASPPCDPADFNRCLKLVAMVPEIKDHFHMIATLSKTWEKIISRWDEIEKSFIDEVGFDWCNAKSAPKTYHLIQEIRSN